MTGKAERSIRLDYFRRGFIAGLVTLMVWLVVRLGGLAPFPPESSLVYLFARIPASVEEPAVQSLGEAAGLLGLAGAILIAAVVYGLIAVTYEMTPLSREEGRGTLSRLESFLAFSLVPWFLFGVVVLPLAGSSYFGVGADFASPAVAWAFPLTILVLQLLWGFLLWRAAPSRLDVSATVSGVKSGVPWSFARRTFIERGAILLGSAALVVLSLGTGLGALVSEGGLLLQSSEGLRPGSPTGVPGAPPIFQDPRLASLVNSEVTTNDSFYRVAIDLFDPAVDASVWSLALTGSVGNPKSYSLDDVKRLPRTQLYDTFICVSNVVNGNLISNADWAGVKLSDLVADAGGALTGASYVVFYSVDGYSVAVPASRALGPDCLLAYEMNGAVLPQRHGYPLRAVIPGLYGMMSAKWVRQIDLVESPYVGYWQSRGWSSDATVRTVSFIRVPSDGSSVGLSRSGGSVLLGGYAFAGDRGISKVEVSVDGGQTWQQASLKPPASDLTWVLWAYEWRPVGPGDYVVYARATDGKGALQTSAVSDSFPSGATGYAMSTVKVTS